MIKFNSRFDEYAYRVGTFDVKDGVTVEEGQFVALDADSNIILAAAGKAGYMAVGSNRAGRDQIAGKAIKKVAFLVGSFSVWTDQVEGTSIAPMTGLAVGTGGKLKAATASDVTVAYALRQQGGFTQIVSA